jgi:hypothetical protein
VDSDIARRIDEALRTGAHTLDLSYCDVESLPESLGELINLTTLYLDDAGSRLTT